MPISIADLFKIPLIYSIDLASDGKLLLYSSNITGLPQLYVLQTEPGSTPKQVTSGSDPAMLGFFSHDANRIVYLQDKDGNELHHLFLTSEEGERAQQITETPYRTFGVGWHPSGEEVARSYIARDSCGLEIYNVKSDERFILKEQRTPLFGLAYSNNGNWIACSEMGGGKDPKNYQVKVVNRNEPDDVINYSFKDGSKESLPSWAPDDRKLAFLTDVNGKNQVVVQGFQSEERLFLDLEEGEEAADIQEPCWAPRSDRVYYVVSKHSRSNLYEHLLDGERTALPFPEGTILFSKISKDGNTVVAHHSSMASPHSIYVYTIDSETLTLLTSRKYKVNLGELAKPKSAWYKSSDGLRIHGWYLPAGHGVPPHPAIVWPHGGPWWQTYDTWSPYLQSLSQSGFAVLAPNFRGSTGYGAEFRNMDLSDAGGGDLEDVVSGAKWLAGRPEIDELKTAIAGGSYGGFMTLIALTKKPDVFSAGVAIVPVTDWLEMYGLSDAAFRKFIEELFEGPPEERKELYQAGSPITYISQIKAPVLIICGRNDSRCPIQPIQKFVDKLKDMQHPHEFRIHEKEGHGFAKVKVNIQEAKTAIEFLKRNLKIQS